MLPAWEPEMGSGASQDSSVALRVARAPPPPPALPRPLPASPSCLPHLDLEMLSESVRDSEGPYFKAGDSQRGPTSVAALEHCCSQFLSGSFSIFSLKLMLLRMSSWVKRSAYFSRE